MHEAPRGLTALSILIFVALNLALFLPSMKGDFIWDDRYFVASNPLVTSPHALKDFLGSPYGGFSGTDENSRALDRTVQFYRPLTSLSFRLDYKLWGLNPAGFHLTNILLHALNAILLFFCLTSAGIAAIPALTAGLLFSAFPTHFENVAWISGRTDLVSFLMAAISALFFLRYLREKAWPALAASSLFFLASLLAKESSLLIAGVFFLLLWRKRESARTVVLSLVPFATAAGVWLLLRQAAFSGAAPHLSGLGARDLLAVTGFYGLKTVVPFGLTVTVDALPVFRSTLYLILGAAMAGLLVWAVLSGASRRAEARFPAWPAYSAFMLLLLPAVAVILSAGVVSLVAWRFLYFSSAVFCAGTSAFLGHILRKKAVFGAVIAIVLAAYAVEAYPKVERYGKSEKDFWLSIKPVRGEDGAAKINRAIRLLDSDEKAGLALFDEVLEEKDHPLYQIWRTRIYEELGGFYTKKTEYGKAEECYQKLFQTDRDPNPPSRFGYAELLGKTGRRQEAESVVRAMTSLYPGSHSVMLLAARFYIEMRDYGRAVEWLQKDYEAFRSPETLTLLQSVESETKR